LVRLVMIGHLVEATHEQRATGWVKITTKSE